MGDPKLTANQAWMLGQVQRAGFDRDEWFRPMDVGGHDANDVSSLLAALCRKGLIERRHRPASTAYLYHLTPAGRGHIADRELKSGSG